MKRTEEWTKDVGGVYYVCTYNHIHIQQLNWRTHCMGPPVSQQPTHVSTKRSSLPRLPPTQACFQLQPSSHLHIYNQFYLLFNEVGKTLLTLHHLKLMSTYRTIYSITAGAPVSSMSPSDNINVGEVAAGVVQVILMSANHSLDQVALQ